MISDRLEIETKVPREVIINTTIKIVRDVCNIVQCVLYKMARFQSYKCTFLYKNYLQYSFKTEYLIYSKLDSML